MSGILAMVVVVLFVLCLLLLCYAWRRRKDRKKKKKRRRRTPVAEGAMKKGGSVGISAWPNRDACRLAIRTRLAGLATAGAAGAAGAAGVAGAVGAVGADVSIGGRRTAIPNRSDSESEDEDGWYQQYPLRTSGPISTPSLIDVAKGVYQGGASQGGAYYSFDP